MAVLGCLISDGIMCGSVKCTAPFCGGAPHIKLRYIKAVAVGGDECLKDGFADAVFAKDPGEYFGTIFTG